MSDRTFTPIRVENIKDKGLTLIYSATYADGTIKSSYGMITLDKTWIKPCTMSDKMNSEWHVTIFDGDNRYHMLYGESEGESIGTGTRLIDERLINIVDTIIFEQEVLNH